MYRLSLPHFPVSFVALVGTGQLQLPVFVEGFCQRYKISSHTLLKEDFTPQMKHLVEMKETINRVIILLHHSLLDCTFINLTFYVVAAGFLSVTCFFTRSVKKFAPPAHDLIGQTQV